MGNIFGYVGRENAKNILLSGIAQFSTQNDMAGIVLKDNDSFISLKTKGLPADLASKSASAQSDATLGLAECSDEYRCKASSITAAPSSNSLFTVAAQGEIENYKILMSQITSPLPVASDEDLLLSLLSVIDEKKGGALIIKASSMLSGDIGFAFVSAAEDAIYCKSGFKKLAVGISKIGYFVSGELSPLIPFCEKYTYLEENEFARLSQDRVLFFDSKQRKIKKTFKTIPDKRFIMGENAACNQLLSLPAAVKNTLGSFVEKGEIRFDNLKLGTNYLNRIDKIVLIGEGSSKNTAFSAKSLFETYCAVTAVAQSSMEFLNSYAPFDKYTLVIAISESGEDIQTLKCIHKAKQSHSKTLALTNNPYGALSQECDFSILAPIGTRFSQSNPISYITNYLALCLLSVFIGTKIKTVSSLYLGVTLKMAEMLPGILSSVIRSSSSGENAAYALFEFDNIFVCSDSFISAKSAEIIRDTAEKNAVSVHSEELENYPEELLKSSAVFALISNNENINSVINSLRRIKNKGAHVFIITSEGNEEEFADFESAVTFTDSLPLFNPISCLAGIYRIAILAKEQSSKQNEERSA